MTRRLNAQTLAMLVGGAFVLVGIAGFVPGVTTSYDELEYAGEDSQAELLGVFEVSLLHNLLHVAVGILGLALAQTAAAARWFLLGGGAAYVALWIFGLAIDLSSDANFIPVNTADNWLHFGLGLTMIGLGVLTSAPRPSSS
jgi:hypothetical protein